MIRPDNTVFFLLSFEGPDRYSQAGGLGVRVTNAAHALAQRGFETHVLFVGDPDAPDRDVRFEGKLIYHRWCQWISRFHPGGVYDGEEGKLNDFIASVPPFVAAFVEKASASGRLPVILAEEWHTAETVVQLSRLLESMKLRHRAVLLWNANNTMSFHRVDWGRLSSACRITTISRYMKHLMWDVGVNPIVIPNGIPRSLLRRVDERKVRALRGILDPEGDAVMLAKFGRFDPAKRWMMAVEAAARFKQQGVRVVFPLVGGVEPHGAEVFRRAWELGLRIEDVNGDPKTFRGLLDLLRLARPSDIYNMRFYLTQEMLRPFYRAADAVLANSGHEPFGLVGLEAMAAGGIVFTGATGEEYAFAGVGAVALDTESPDEIVSQVAALRAHPYRALQIRKAARTQAARFTWDRVIDVLLDKIAFCAGADTVHRLQEHLRDARTERPAAPVVVGGGERLAARVDQHDRAG